MPGKWRAKSTTCWPVPLPSSTASPYFSGEEPQQHRTDRLMIAVKGRGVEPPVGLNGSAIPAEFNAIFRHAGSCRSPDREVDLTCRTANRKAGRIEADN